MPTLSRIATEIAYRMKDTLTAISRQLPRPMNGSRPALSRGQHPVRRTLGFALSMSKYTHSTAASNLLRSAALA